MNDCRIFVGAAHWVDRLPNSLPGVETSTQRFSMQLMTGVLEDKDHLTLKCSSGGKPSSVHLVRNKEGLLQGKYQSSDYDRASQGLVVGRLFFGVAGIFFYGSWTSDNGIDRMTFWADLEADRTFEGRTSCFVDDGLDFLTITKKIRSD